jgi:hypothetical protein
MARSMIAGKYRSSARPATRRVRELPGILCSSVLSGQQPLYGLHCWACLADHLIAVTATMYREMLRSSMWTERRKSW